MAGRPFQRYEFLSTIVMNFLTMKSADIGLFMKLVCYLQQKKTGIICPFVYFVDPLHAEIIMEFIQGTNVKEIISSQLCCKIGFYSALLHDNNIIHGDLTASNFILSEKIVLIDFGLSY